MKRIAIAFALAVSCFAVDPPAPMRSRVQVINVKADMNQEWLDLQKNELVPALKKAGVKTRTVYSTRFGPRGQYVVLTPFTSFAEFQGDSPLVKALGPVGAARLNAKLMKCMAGETDYVATRQDDLSNLVDLVERPAPYIVVQRFRVTPGKETEFRNLLRSEILPIYVKAKTRWVVQQRGLGAHTLEFSAAALLDSMAELDPGSKVRQSMGNEGVEKFLARTASLFTMMETEVRERLADLSY